MGNVCNLQKFLFDGRLIFGPDAKSLIVTFTLILVPVVTFCVFVARNLVHEFSTGSTGYAIMVLAIVFTIYVSSLPFIWPVISYSLWGKVWLNSSFPSYFLRRYC